MAVPAFSLRAGLSRFLAEIQDGGTAPNAIVAKAAMAPAALSRSFAALERGTAILEAFSDRARKAQSFLNDLAKTVKGTAEFAGSIDRVARMASVSAESLQELRFAATQSGADTTTLDTGLVAFGEQVRQARTGPSGFGDLLEQSGIPLDDAEGRARALEDVFIDFAEAVRNARDPVKQGELALAGFGTEGAVLVDLLAGGREGIVGLQEEARRLGVVLNRFLIAELKEANAQFSKLEQIVDVNLKRGVASEIPALAESAGQLATLAPALKDLTESVLPVDLRSSESLRREVEEKLGDLRTLRKSEDPEVGFPDPQAAKSGSPERHRRLQIERLVIEIAELVALLQRREQAGASRPGSGPALRPQPERMNFGDTTNDLPLIPVAFDPAGIALRGAGPGPASSLGPEALRTETDSIGPRLGDIGGQLERLTGQAEALGVALEHALADGLSERIGERTMALDREETALEDGTAAYEAYGRARLVPDNAALLDNGLMAFRAEHRELLQLNEDYSTLARNKGSALIQSQGLIEAEDALAGAANRAAQRASRRNN